MDRTLILMQLAFNVLMFAALAALAWRSRGAAPRKARAERARTRPDEQVAAFQRAAAAAGAGRPIAAPNEAPAPSAGLDDLIERAERRELAAEAALRGRLARFRDQSAEN